MSNEKVKEGIAFPCDQESVKKLLPHRYPFLWVTRILECEPGESIVAELDVDPDLEIFKGHFPEYPVFPGVLIMEALAQASCCCLLADPNRENSIGFFAGIDKARFREQVKPGDTIRLEAEVLKANKKFCKTHVRAFKGDKLAAEADQSYIMASSMEG